MRTLVRIAVAVSVVALLSVFNASPASAAIDMVVIHVEGAPFERGDVIDGSVPLRLDAGWSITLVASDGTFVTLAGPSESVPSEIQGSENADPKILEAIGALISARENSTAALGVIRSYDGASSSIPLPDAWAVSVERPGTACVRPDVVMFWRHNATPHAILKIAMTGTTRSAIAMWPAGEEMLLVTGSDFDDGASYTFEIGGRRVERTIHMLPPDLSGAVEQVAWMAEKGCEEQAVAMLDSIR